MEHCKVYQISLATVLTKRFRLFGLLPATLGILCESVLHHGKQAYKGTERDITGCSTVSTMALLSMCYLQLDLFISVFAMSCIVRFAIERQNRLRSTIGDCSAVGVLLAA